MLSVRLAALSAVLALLGHRFEAVEAKTRKMTVANSCSYTIWPALFTSVGPPPTNTPTGWEAPSGTSWTFEVEESWGGRIWPRTDCDFSDSSKPGSLQCATGACNGGLECDPKTGTGVPPCSLAEFNLQENIDHYDSSNVDGFSIPMAITSNGDFLMIFCQRAPLNCGGKTLPGRSSGASRTAAQTRRIRRQYCCFGAHDTLETCPLSGIPNYDFWLKGCPISYIYAYGDALALFTCTKRVDWTITFCPGPDSFDTKVTFPDGKTTTQGSGFPAPTAVAITRTGVTAGSGGAGPTSKGETSATTKSGASPTSGTAPPAAETGATSTGAAGTDGANSASGSNTGAGTDTSSGSDSAPDAGSAAVPAGSGTSSGSDSGVDASSSNSAASEIMGIPSTYVYVFAGALALAVIAAVAFLLSKRRTNRHKHVAQSDDDGSTASEGSSSDSEAAHASHKSRKKRQSDCDTGDDDGTTARSLGALAAMEQAEHLAARQSVYAAAAKNEGGLAQRFFSRRQLERRRTTSRCGAAVR
ncbi:hypothetical protein BMF94_4298 [Rhodotorula taiwanensis]|uniref:Osmotin, thaumatin-like protein n=1 Tax=Rhodotorula taiwanensis TaxID=741276 RepID=A0A2S5B6R8_9BASI|nr:hypothetical protein BMF94_4298 [Rhodotorula taiwanensis]